MKVATHRIKVGTNKTMTALWLSMGEEELFLSSHAATLLGCSRQNIEQIIAKLRNQSESLDSKLELLSSKSLESHTISQGVTI